MSMEFFQELKRRNVFRVGAAYAVTAWLLAQVADLVRENFSVPETAVQWLLLALLAGFPVALVLAWLYELTPEGVRKEKDVDRSRPDYRQRGKKLDRAIIVILIAALSYFVWESRFSPDPAAEPGIQAPPVAELPEDDIRSIAVLPFENFSADPSDSYFADGLADTLLHKLAQIGDLKVIARNSSFQFKGSNRDIREIGKILDVSTVLEGSVQRQGQQVRIIAQLINASDGAHLWSQSFDDRMSNIFSLQDRIAEAIVEQLQVTISDKELERVLRDSTDSPEAYDLFMLATADNPDYDTRTEASEETYLPIQLLKKAVEVDPEFALAWAELSKQYNSLAWATESNMEFQRYIEKGKEAATRALEIDPELDQAHVAMGFIVWRERNVIAAMESYRRALELNPNNAGAMAGLGLAVLRDDPEEAYRLFNRVGELNPAARMTWRQKSFALLAMNQPDEAVSALEQGILKHPDEYLFYSDLAEISQSMHGRPDRAAEILSDYLRLNGNSLNASVEIGSYWTDVGDQARAEAWARHVEEDYGPSDRLNRLYRRIEAVNGNIVTDDTATMTEIQGARSLGQMVRLATFCLQSGDHACVIEWSDRIATEYERLVEQGSNFEALGRLTAILRGAALYGSGQIDAGAAILEPLIEPLKELPATTVGFASAGRGYTLAGVYSIQGRLDDALGELEKTLEFPDGGFISRDQMGLPPEHSLLLANLRGDPGFQAWLERFEARRSAAHDRMTEMESNGQIITPDQL